MCRPVLRVMAAGMSCVDAITRRTTAALNSERSEGSSQAGLRRGPAFRSVRDEWKEQSRRCASVLSASHMLNRPMCLPAPPPNLRVSKLCIYSPLYVHLQIVYNLYAATASVAAGFRLVASLAADTGTVASRASIGPPNFSSIRGVSRQMVIWYGVQYR